MQPVRWSRTSLCFFPLQLCGSGKTMPKLAKNFNCGWTSSSRPTRWSTQSRSGSRIQLLVKALNLALAKDLNQVQAKGPELRTLLLWMPLWSLVPMMWHKLWSMRSRCKVDGLCCMCEQREQHTCSTTQTKIGSKQIQLWRSLGLVVTRFWKLTSPCRTRLSCWTCQVMPIKLRWMEWSPPLEKQWQPWGKRNQTARFVITKFWKGPQCQSLVSNPLTRWSSCAKTKMQRNLASTISLHNFHSMGRAVWSWYGTCGGARKVWLLWNQLFMSRVLYRYHQHMLWNSTDIVISDAFETGFWHVSSGLCGP